MKQTAMDDDDVDTVADDETHVNSNLRGNEDKCKEIFGNIHFPELDEPVPPMDPVAWKAADKNECKRATNKQGKYNNLELIVKWRCNNQDVQMKLAHPDPIAQSYLAMGILLKAHHK